MEVQQWRFEMHEDKRGRLVEISRASQMSRPVNFVYTTVTHPKSIRAAHYHKEKWEWFFVTLGLARITLRDIDTGERKTVLLNGRRPSLLEIKPRIHHTIEVVGDNDVHLTAMSNKEFDADDSDTFCE